jgi:anaerobic C4-dicarboxylate transporter
VPTDGSNYAHVLLINDALTFRSKANNKQLFGLTRLVDQSQHQRQRHSARQSKPHRTRLKSFFAVTVDLVLVALATIVVLQQLKINNELTEEETARSGQEKVSSIMMQKAARAFIACRKSAIG